MRQKNSEPPLPPKPLRERTWFRSTVVVAALLLFGAVRLPLEIRLNEEHRAAFFHGAKLNLGLRQQIGQLSFLAALSGFRAAVADGLWIQAYTDWTRTEWGKMLLLFNEVTALEPRNVMFWDMSAWHMGWNASVNAFEDTSRPLAVRLKAQHEYFIIAKDFLDRGIANNPDRYTLFERLATLERDKLRDHCDAAIQYAKAASFPESPGYEKRFAVYELSRCPGHEREAYTELVQLYRKGESEWLPTLLDRLNVLQERLNIPQSQRIIIPKNLLPPQPY